MRLCRALTDLHRKEHLRVERRANGRNVGGRRGRDAAVHHVRAYELVSVGTRWDGFLQRLEHPAHSNMNESTTIGNSRSNFLTS
jgi:hypothetical protein